MTGVTRRELINGVVGLSVLTYVVGYAVPIAVEEMFQAAPRGLTIEGGVTHLIASGVEECYTYVSWLDGGAQLAIEDGGQVCFKP